MKETFHNDFQFNKSVPYTQRRMLLTGYGGVDTEMDY